MAQSHVELREFSNDTQEQSPVGKNVAGEASSTPLSTRSSMTAREPATTVTYVLLWPVVVFLFYAAFALFPWATLCIMSKRPIRKETAYYSTDPVTYYPELWYDVNEKYFKTAQILQSITTLITIPVTTAICSMACVTYMQAGSLRKSLTLRQSMALADHGWVSPRILAKFATMGSLPLYVAFALTVIGSVSQILQSAFVDHESILASSARPSYISITDVPNLFNEKSYYAHSNGTPTDYGRLTVNLRALFESPFTSYDDTNNWGMAFYPHEYVGYSNLKKDGGIIYAPLASNFTTGAYPVAQFAPRINSSVISYNITESEYKDNCRNETDNGGFYARYRYIQNDTDGDMFTIVDFEACMTKDLRISPWNSTRDRQDITEELFLSTYQASTRNLSYWRISSNTSLGYFEVPSAQNGNIPGPLLDKDPLVNDKTQIWGNRYKDSYKRDRNISYTTEATYLGWYNKGPLASVAIALFGPDSFVGARMSNPSNFALAPDAKSRGGYSTGDSVCVYRVPLSLGFNFGGCITRDESLYEHQAIEQVQNFLYRFSYQGFQRQVPAVISNALFMANKLWLSQSTSDSYDRNQLAVYHDDGIRTTKPKISHTGIVVGSLFLGLHLLGLMLLAVYIGIMKPWSGRMGAEIMVKMGMVYSDVLARSETEHQWKKTVSELPGYIGDDRPEEEIGRMRLGAASGLGIKKNRMFEVLR